MASNLNCHRKQRIGENTLFSHSEFTIQHLRRRFSENSHIPNNFTKQGVRTMKRKIVKWGSVVVALLFTMSTFTVSANMCHNPSWAAFHADGGMYENQCDIEQEWIAGYYASQVSGTFSNDGSHSVADFIVTESNSTSQLIISRVDGTNPIVMLDGGAPGSGLYTDTMSISSSETLHYGLSVDERSGVITIHYSRRTVQGRVGKALTGTVKATFKAKDLYN